MKKNSDRNASATNSTDDDDVAVEQAAHGLHALARRAALRRTAAPSRRGRATRAARAPARTRRRAIAEQRGAHAEPAAGDPGLRQVDEVVVDDEAEQREQQVPVAGAARIGGRQADAEQQQVGAAEHQAEAPGQLALVARRRLAQQVDACRARRRRQRSARAQRALAGQHAVGLEARQRLLAVVQVLLVALARSSTRKRSSPSTLDAAAARRGHRLAVGLSRRG